MFSIDKFLDKFSKTILSSENTKTVIIEIINKHTGIVISKEDFEIKNYIVVINSSPGVKNKIFINKEKIITDILKETSEKIVDLK